MSMAESIRNYLAACPLMPTTPALDDLGAAAGCTAILALPGLTTLTRYTDGGSLKQTSFAFFARLPYGDLSQNRENLALLERICHWLEDQTKAGKLPRLDDDQVAVALRPTTSPAAEEKDFYTATYQVQLKLTYFER